MEHAILSNAGRLPPSGRSSEPLRWVRGKELGALPRPWGARRVWTIRRPSR